MNDPVSAFNGISALLASLSGLHVGAVGPKDAGYRYPTPGEQARVDFDLISNVGLGLDELRRTYDPDAIIEGDTSGSGGAAATGGFIDTVTGDRVQTWQVKVQCGRQDATAHRYAERIRNGLGLPSSRRALRALGLGLQQPIGSTVSVPFTEGNRVISAVVFEFKTNSTGSATDTPVTTINEVEGLVQANTDADPPPDPFPIVLHLT